MVCDQLGPVAVVGDDQRQLDAALAGAGAHAHPARGEGGDGIGEPPRPAVLQRRGRAEHDLTRQLARSVADQRQPAEIDAELGVEGAHAGERAVQPDRLVVAGGAQQGDQPLRLAEAVGADEMAALRKGGQRGEQAADLARVRFVAEHRQPERRLRHEQVAGHQLERRRGRIGAALVVAGDYRATALVLDHHLGAAEDMAGRRQPHAHATQVDRLTVAQRLEAAGRLGAESGLHDGDGLRSCQHRAMSGPRMVGVAVGDDGALDGSCRIDVEAGRRAAQSGGVELQPILEPAGRHWAPRRRNCAAGRILLRERWGRQPGIAARPGGIPEPLDLPRRPA